MKNSFPLLPVTIKVDLRGQHQRKYFAGEKQAVIVSADAGAGFSRVRQNKALPAV